MIEKNIFWTLLALEFVMIPFVAFRLMFFTVPYGRYFKKEGINAALGWFFMEIPAVIIFAAGYFSGNQAFHFIPLLFFVLWQAHYIDRSFFYPFRIARNGKNMPLSVVLMGFCFNVVNGYLNGRYLTYFGPQYQMEWLYDPRFIVGIILFVSGFIINRYSDGILLSLKKNEKDNYKIPRGFLFKFISCPNYFGEIIEWTGWALATWSPAGLAFAMFTMANLIPRAFRHHLWYHEKFPGYPAQRKAVLPFLF